MKECYEYGYAVFEQSADTSDNSSKCESALSLDISNEDAVNDTLTKEESNEDTEF